MEKLAVLRYSRALFDLAVEKNQVAPFHDACDAILAVLQSDKDMLGLINHPGIPFEKKLEIIAAAFAGRVPEEFLGLFALLLRRGRKNTILGVLAHFNVLYKEYTRSAVAKIYSPSALSPEKISEIAAVLSQKLNKTVQAENVVDESLIAGFRVEVDGLVFDSSLKYQMNRMKKQLLGGFY